MNPLRVRIIGLGLAIGLLGGCSQPSAGGSSVPASGSQLRTIARPHWTRTSLGTFADPYGVAVNPYCKSSCDVFVADAGAKRVWKIAPDGTRSPIGDWVDAPAFDPQGVAVDRYNSVYVADKEPGKQTRIWKIATNGATTVVDIRSFGNVFDVYFRGVAIEYPPTKPPYLYTCVLGVQAKHTSVVPTGALENSCLSTIKLFSDPYGVAADGSGNWYVADAGTKTVYILPEHRTPIALRVFADPYGVAASLDGSSIFVADAGGKRVWVRDLEGAWSVVGDFADPYGVAVDASGMVYVADPGSKTVWKVTP